MKKSKKNLPSFYSFDDIADFQKWLKGENKKPFHLDYINHLDYITINNITYTMHEYDKAGQIINWANKKHNKMIELNTTNRYVSGLSDARVIEYKADWLRDDVVYYE